MVEERIEKIGVKRSRKRKSKRRNLTIKPEFVEQSFKLVSAEGNQLVNQVPTEAQMTARLRWKADQLKIEEYGRRQGYFIWVMSSSDGGLFNEIKQSDLARLFYLATFINEEGYLSSSNGRHYTKAGAENLLHVANPTFKKFWTSMTSYGLLIENESGILVNTTLFRRGALIRNGDSCLNYGRLYIGAMRSLYEGTDPNTHKQLGYILKIIPYLHRSRNVVCQDPSSLGEESSKPMGWAEICATLGYSISHYDRLKKLFLTTTFKYDGRGDTAVVGELARQLIVTTADGRTEQKVYFNPYWFYAGSNAQVVGLLEIFE